MFGISNQIAYDGLMVFGTPDRPAFPGRDANVAVTRAKRRLYVIGNRDTWGNEPYFNVLAARIPAEYQHPI